jgi:hypothetical protein
MLCVDIRLYALALSFYSSDVDVFLLLTITLLMDAAADVFFISLGDSCRTS